MEINDINKVASRKRINAEAEKLREKVSRETAKIIKLKVAQDTAYWDLKEKLQQVEANHEKLQQNMVEVQMQHEAISGQYQEELRLRPDTLNKLSSTRAICDVLEDYSERLKDTLSRCKADQTALCEAYQRSGQLVREIKAKQVESGEKSQSLIEGLEEKVKLMSGHQNQLLQFFTAAKQQADAEIADLRNKLTSMTAHKEEFTAVQNELNRKLDQCKFDIEKKEEINANLRAEIKKLMQEFNNQASEARAVLAKQDKEIKDRNEENESLKRALSNQEQFTKTICEQNNTLQEKIAVLEDEQSALVKVNGELKLQAEESSGLNRNLQNNITILNDEKRNLLQEIHGTKEVLKKLELEIENMKNNHSMLETEKADLRIELNKAIEESTNKGVEIEKLTGLKVSLEEKLAEIEANFQTQRNIFDEKIKELDSLIETKVKEIDSKASTINQLMSELKASTDIRSKLELALQKMSKEFEIERDAVREKEKKLTNTIGQLENVVRNKDDELSKQMSIILEMRNEKERLQEKIQSMQNTIDNIQKELTRPPPQADPDTRQQPEQDDNAVMLTPSHKQTHLMQPASPILSGVTEFVKPRAQEPKLDNMLYNLFSDSSMDGDSLDSSEVTRRFNALARGERPAPVPLAALRRRCESDKESRKSLSKVKNDLKNKERTFFKNKRLDNNTKRAK